MEYPKTLATWLVCDDKALTSSLDKDVFALAAQLEREPLSVLRRLREDRAAESLAKAGVDFQFEHGTEEEAEFFGLALSGMPLIHVLRWCLGSQERLDPEGMAANMPHGDCRPSLHMAREVGIWFSRAEEVETLRALEETMPPEIIQEAVREILSRFDAPTPGLVMRCVEGEAPPKDRPYKWYVEGQNSGCTSRTYASKAKRRSPKAKKSYSRSGWKPRKKSRYARSY